MRRVYVFHSRGGKTAPSKHAVRLCEKIAEGRISGSYAAEQIERSCGLENRRTNA